MGQISAEILDRTGSALSGNQDFGPPCCDCRLRPGSTRVQGSVRARRVGVFDRDRQRSWPRECRNRSLGDREGLHSGRQRFGTQVVRPHGALRCRTGSLGPEAGVINPHPVKDRPDAPCQGDHRALRATAAGNLRGPCSQPGRTATVHHDRRSLAQGASKVDVARLGDPA